MVLLFSLWRSDLLLFIHFFNDSDSGCGEGRDAFIFRFTMVIYLFLKLARYYSFTNLNVGLFSYILLREGKDEAERIYIIIFKSLLLVICFI